MGTVALELHAGPPYCCLPGPRGVAWFNTCAIPLTTPLLNIATLLCDVQSLFGCIQSGLLTASLRPRAKSPFGSQGPQNYGPKRENRVYHLTLFRGCEASSLPPANDTDVRVHAADIIAVNEGPQPRAPPALKLLNHGIADGRPAVLRPTAPPEPSLQLLRDLKGGNHGRFPARQDINGARRLTTQLMLNNPHLPDYRRICVKT